MIVRAIWVQISLLALRTCALFLEPDEGDVRHIYPILYLGIGFDTHAHTVPYLLGWLENLEYPKDRIRLEMFIGSKEDATIHQVKWWIDSTRKYFRHVKLVEEEDNWLESALRNARLQKASRCILISADSVPTETGIVKYLFNESKHVVVVPVFQSIDGSTNVEDPSEDLMNRVSVREQIATFALPIAIDLTAIDSSYLTFDRNNLPFYEGADDPSQVFVTSADNMRIVIWADNQINYGIYVNPELDLNDRRNTIRYHLADIVADNRRFPHVSRSVRAYREEPSKYGVDKIYLINLKRRNERLERMRKIFELLGIEFELFEATDGQKLNELEDRYKDYRILEGYLDPISRRPMKNGEIGCFLSHYRIWEDVIRNEYEKVIVFEDDLRFGYDGMKRVEEVLEDLEASKKLWDLIYLGRKKQSNEEELWISEHRHLSSVQYSYWTLGYMLSQSGAKKLLATNPLEKMIPVDEYLPIMYDKHPNQEWCEKFTPRDLLAFTLYPLVVSPQRYTNEPGYISDTEDSMLITNPGNHLRNEEL